MKNDLRMLIFDTACLQSRIIFCDGGGRKND